MQSKLNGINGKKYMKPGYIWLYLLFIAVFLWYAVLNTGSSVTLILAIIAMGLTILCVCFLALAISDKYRLSVSPYRIIAIVTIILGVVIAGVGIYDINTSTGFFAGILGTMLLIIATPVVVFILSVDFILWKRSSCKKK